MEMALSSQRKMDASRKGHSERDCGAKGKMPFNLAIACASCFSPTRLRQAFMHPSKSDPFMDVIAWRGCKEWQPGVLLWTTSCTQQVMVVRDECPQLMTAVPPEFLDAHFIDVVECIKGGQRALFPIIWLPA